MVQASARYGGLSAGLKKFTPNVRIHERHREVIFLCLPGDDGKRKTSMLAHKENPISNKQFDITEGRCFLPIAVSRWAKRNTVSVSSVPRAQRVVKSGSPNSHLQLS